MSNQTIMLGKKLFEFSSKADWIEGASRIWRLHEVTADNATCVDQLGRICTVGLHFVEAERDNAYPIEVFMTRPETTPKAQPAEQDLPDLIAGSLGVSRGTAYDMMREALAEQPTQQEPKATNQQIIEWADRHDLKGTITDLRSALEDAKTVYTTTVPPAQPLTGWVPLTQELLNEQHEWLYEPMWIAMKDGSVLQGYYEWRQGWNPDRLLADGGDYWAFDAAYVMPMVKPTPPAEAAHGITKGGAA